MAQIIRGTTPVLEFTYKDITVSDITKAILTIAQNGSIIIEKDLTTATVRENSLTWTLSQEESLTLNASRNARIVCDWVLSNGTRGRSNVLMVDVGEPGKDEVI